MATSVRRSGCSAPAASRTPLRIADEILRRTTDQRTAVLPRAAGPPDNVTAGWADSVTIGACSAGGQVASAVTDHVAAEVPARGGRSATTEPPPRR